MFSFFAKNKQPQVFVSAVIVAAGSASRMEGIDKIHAEVYDLPVIVHTLLAFEDSPSIGEIVVVTKEEDFALFLDYKIGYNITKLGPVVRGGGSRQESVFIGIENCRPNAEYFAIHDGARPLVTPQIIEACAADAKREGAAIAAVKAKDTIKKAAADGFVAETPNRNELFMVQTPQVFEAQKYKQAMQHAKNTKNNYTDDSALFEAVNYPVYLSLGDYRNIKITTPEDLQVAQAFFESMQEV